MRASRTAIWNAVVVVMFLAAMVHLFTFARSQSSYGDGYSDGPPGALSSASLDVKFEGYWSAQLADAETEVQYVQYAANQQGEHASMVASGLTPLQVVPNTPRFDDMRRGWGSTPTASWLVDRPPPDTERLEVQVPINCLTTREPGLRAQPGNRSWTVEVVVHFMNNDHFGRAWQTVFGRTGRNFTNASTFDADLGAMAIKVAPDMHLLFEAWIARRGQAPLYVSLRTTTTLYPGEWYHIVGRGSGSTVELFVNGKAAAAYVGPPEDGIAALSTPPRLDHGDLTVGCGMHAGQTSDSCSCMVAEARVSPQALSPSSWLWRPAEQKSLTRCGKGLKVYAGVCIGAN